MNIKARKKRFFSLVSEIPLELVFQKLGLKIHKKYLAFSPLAVKIRCPFHNEATPSFILYNNRSWRCFSCGMSGSGVFRFVLLYFSKDYGKACRWFNKSFHIPLPWK
ncbi:hypothetical protein KKC45_00950 [Patescibacteria group bacterium]|nr:hypothetical protein [Patescibacteria group bacterium]